MTNGFMFASVVAVLGEGEQLQLLVVQLFAQTGLAHSPLAQEGFTQSALEHVGFLQTALLPDMSPRGLMAIDPNPPSNAPSWDVDNGI